MDFKDKYKLSKEDLEKLAKNDQKEYTDTMSKYPYGKEENDRILALSDEEFEKELGDNYRSMLEEYEQYKHETAEFQMYSYDDVAEAKSKYEYFKNMRSHEKEDDEQEK